MAGDTRPPYLRAILLGLLCFTIYLTNLRFTATGDSIPARLLPFSILREGNLDLTEFGWIQSPGYRAYYIRKDKQRRLWSAYPILPGLLATPIALPVALWLDRRGVSDDAVTFRVAVVVVERVTAAMIAAASVSLLFLAACLVSTPRIALGTALAYAFGTNTWAMSSQALWQHGPVELFLCGLSLCLLGPASGGRILAAGACAALAVAARPPMIIFALLALLFVWRERRAWLVQFLIGPVLLGGALLTYNWTVFGRVSGGYVDEQFTPSPLVRLAGLLISPSRGLLIYTPAVLLALPGVAAARVRGFKWLLYLAVAVAAHVLLLCFYVGWYAGHCWGPRYLTDVLPAFALLAACAADHVLRNRLTRVLAALAVGWGVAVQVVGVYFDDRSWDQLPVPVEQRPERVWDWTDPQILRAVRAGWHGSDLAPLLWQTIFAEGRALLQPLSEGDLAGRISTSTPLPERWAVDQRRTVTLQIHNDGHQSWPAFSSVGFLHVGVLERWWCNGTQRPESAGYFPLRRNLAAGMSDTLPVRLTVPSANGNCEVELRIIQLLGADTGRAGGALRFTVKVD